jgi:ParB-like nuclease domain
MIESPPTVEIQSWPIERFVFYARNPRKNDAAVDRMCSSIREYGFKVPVLARSDGEVVDGHLRLKAARKLGSWPGGDTNSIPVILCDEWTAGGAVGQGRIHLIEQILCADELTAVSVLQRLQQKASSADAA